MNRESDEEFRRWAVDSGAALRRTAFLLSGDWHLADDLVQEALIRMYVAWPRVGTSGSLGGYARRVLVNLYIDHRRRPARREQPARELPEGEVVVESLDGYRDQLLSALRLVPPGQRTVLVLRFWEDLSIDQVAEALGTSTGTVKSQTSRGLDALRRALADRGLTDAFSLEEST